MRKISLIKKILIMAILTIGASACAYMANDIAVKKSSLKVGLQQDQIVVQSNQSFDDQDEDWVLHIKGKSTPENESNSSALFAQSDDIKIESNQPNMRASQTPTDAVEDYYIPGELHKFPAVSNKRPGYELLGFKVTSIDGTAITVPKGGYTPKEMGSGYWYDDMFTQVVFVVNTNGYLCAISEITEVGKDITLIPVWKTIQFTITYDLNGGSSINASDANQVAGYTQFYKVTDSVTLASAGRTDYKFSGWKVIKVDYTVSGYQYDWPKCFDEDEEITHLELELGSGHYGNITLEAIWWRPTVSFEFSLGEVKSSYNLEPRLFKYSEIDNDAGLLYEPLDIRDVYFEPNIDTGVEAIKVIGWHIIIDEKEYCPEENTNGWYYCYGDYATSDSEVFKFTTKTENGVNKPVNIVYAPRDFTIVLETETTRFVSSKVYLGIRGEACTTQEYKDIQDVLLDNYWDKESTSLYSYTDDSSVPFDDYYSKAVVRLPSVALLDSFTHEFLYIDDNEDAIIPDNNSYTVTAVEVESGEYYISTALYLEKRKKPMFRLEPNGGIVYDGDDYDIYDNSTKPSKLLYSDKTVYMSASIKGNYSNYTFVLPKVTRKDYEFAGWRAHYNGNAEYLYQIGNTYTLSSDYLEDILMGELSVDFEAEWKPRITYSSGLIGDWNFEVSGATVIDENTCIQSYTPGVEFVFPDASSWYGDFVMWNIIAIEGYDLFEQSRNFDEYIITCYTDDIYDPIAIFNLSSDFGAEGFLQHECNNKSVVLEAVWIQKEITLTVDGNGETLDGKNVITNKYTRNQAYAGGYLEALEERNDLNNNEMFKGWFYDKECTQEIRIYDFTITEDTTVYAGWKTRANIILSSINICDEDADKGDDTKFNFDDIDETYQLADWNKNGLDTDGDVEPDKYMEIMARSLWEGTLILESIRDITANLEKKYNYAYSITWYNDSDCVDQVSDSEVLTEESMTIYAHWTLNLFKLNLYANSSEEDDEFEFVKVANGDGVAWITGECNLYIYAYIDCETPLNITDETQWEFAIKNTTYPDNNYRFMGWYEDINDNGSIDDSETEFKETSMPPRELTLYAKWEREYTVTFYDATNPPSYTSLTDLTKICIAGETFELPTFVPQAIGYELNYWEYNNVNLSDKSNDYQVGDSFECGEADIMMYGITKLATYTITYKIEEETGSLNTSGIKPELTGSLHQYRYGDSIILAGVTITDSDKEFKGWRVVETEDSTSDRNDDRTNWSRPQYDGGAELIGMYGNVTLQAIIEDKQYTIRYDLNEVEGDIVDDDANPSVEDNIQRYTSNDEIKLASATSDGREFKGWKVFFIDGNSSGWRIESTIGIDELLVGKDKRGNVQLKAVWELNKYTITYDLDGGHFTDGSGNTTQVYSTGSVTLKSAGKYNQSFIGWEVINSNGGNWVVEKIYKETVDFMYGDVTLKAVWGTSSGGGIIIAPPTIVTSVRTSVATPTMEKTTRAMHDMDDIVVGENIYNVLSALEDGESDELGDISGNPNGYGAYQKLKDNYDRDDPLKLYYNFLGYQLADQNQNLYGDIGRVDLKKGEDTTTYTTITYTDNATYRFVFIVQNKETSADPIPVLTHLITEGATWWIPEATISLKPVFKANKYTITYRADDPVETDANYTINGVQQTEYSMDYYHSVEINHPKVTKEGWVFTGWKVSVAEGENLTDTSKYCSWNEQDNYVDNRPLRNYAGDVTLTAQWTQDEFTITLKGMGGKFKSPIFPGWRVETNNDGEEYAVRTYSASMQEILYFLTSAYISKDHYTFKGWKNPVPTSDGADFRDSQNDEGYYIALRPGSTGNFELEADWEINQYTIIIDANGEYINSNSGWTLCDENGDISDDWLSSYAKKENLTVLNYYQELISAVSHITTEYGEFENWYDFYKPDDVWGNIVNEGYSLKSKENGATITFYAKWKPKYTLTLDLYENSNKYGTITKLDGVEWQLIKEDGSDDTINLSSSYVKQSFVEGTEYCQYLPDFSNNEEAEVAEGYTFEGWYDQDGTVDNNDDGEINEADWGTRLVGTETITGNTTIYARWIPAKAIVQLMAEGGTFDNLQVLLDDKWGIVGNNEGVQKVIDYGSSIILPSISKIGSKFNGWSTTRGSSSGANAGVELTITSLTPTYYACWEAYNYTITLKGTDAYPINQDDLNGNNWTYDANDTYTFTYQKTKDFTLPSISRSGKMNVKNWVVVDTGYETVMCDDISTAWKNGDEYTPGQCNTEHIMYGNVTLQANWEFSKYTLTLDFNGVDNNGNPMDTSKSSLEVNKSGNWLDGEDYYTLIQEVEYDYEILPYGSITEGGARCVVLPADPIREGYKFLYWSTTQDGLKKWQARMPNNDLTLYAVWMINQSILMLDANGGLFDEPTEGSGWTGMSYGNYIFRADVEFGSVISDYIAVTTTRSLSRQAYDFVGWYTKNGSGDNWGTGIYYKDDESWIINNNFTMPKDGLILYAKWVEHEYSVKIESQVDVWGSTESERINDDGKSWKKTTEGKNIIYSSTYTKSTGITLLSTDRNGYEYYHTISGIDTPAADLIWKYTDINSWSDYNTTESGSNYKYILNGKQINPANDGKNDIYYKYLTLNNDCTTTNYSYGDLTLVINWVPIEYTISYQYSNGIAINSEDLTTVNKITNENEPAKTTYTIEDEIYLPTKLDLITITSWLVVGCDGYWGDDVLKETYKDVNDGYFGNVTLQLNEINARTIYIDPRYENYGGELINNDLNIIGRDEDLGLYYINLYEDVINYNAENIYRYIYKNGYGNPSSLYGWVQVDVDADVDEDTPDLYRFSGDSLGINQGQEYGTADRTMKRVTDSDDLAELQAEGKLYIWKPVTMVDNKTILAFNTVYAQYGNPIEFSIEYYVDINLDGDTEDANENVDANGNPTSFTILGNPIVSGDDTIYTTYNLHQLNSDAYPVGYTHKTVTSQDGSTIYYCYTISNNNDEYYVAIENGYLKKGEEIRWIGVGNYLTRNVDTLKLQAVLIPIEYDVTYEIPEEDHNPISTSNWISVQNNDAKIYTIKGMPNGEDYINYTLITDTNKDKLFETRDDQNAITLKGWTAKIDELITWGLDFKVLGGMELGENFYSGVLKLTTNDGYYELQVDRFKYDSEGGIKSYIATDILKGSYGNITLRGVFEVHNYKLTYRIPKENAGEYETITKIAFYDRNTTIKDTSYNIEYTYYDTFNLAISITIAKEVVTATGTETIESEHSISSWTFVEPELKEGKTNNHNWGDANTIYNVWESEGVLQSYANKYGDAILQVSLNTEWTSNLTIIIRPEMTVEGKYEITDLTEDELDSLITQGYDNVQWKKIEIPMSASGGYITPRTIVSTNGYDEISWTLLTELADNILYKNTYEDDEGILKIQCSEDATIIVAATPIDYTIKFYKLANFTEGEAEELTGEVFDDITFNIETGGILPEPLQENGYIFNGWEVPTTTGGVASGTYPTEDNLDTREFGTGKYLPPCTTTLHMRADFGLRYYSVIYNVPVNSAGDNPTPTEFDNYARYNIQDGLILPSEVSIKPGYDFKGWIVTGATYSTIDDSTVYYTADKTDSTTDTQSYFILATTTTTEPYLCTNILAGSYGDITLQAIISPIEYSIRMDANKEELTNTKGLIVENYLQWVLTTSAYIKNEELVESQYALGKYTIESDNYVLPTSEDTQVKMDGYIFKGWKIYGFEISDFVQMGESDDQGVYGTLTATSESATLKVKVNCVSEDKGVIDFSVLEIMTGSYGNVQLTALWEVNTYNLIFDANGGQVLAPDSNEYTLKDKDSDGWKDVEVDATRGDGAIIALNYHSEYKNTLIEDDKMLRYGYEFKGWYTDDGIGGEWGECVNDKKDSECLMPAQNLTLYAKWEIIEYQITYTHVTSEDDTDYKPITDAYGNPIVYNYTITDTFELLSIQDGDKWHVGICKDGNWGNEYDYGEIVEGKYGNVLLYTIIRSSIITLNDATIDNYEYADSMRTQLPKFEAFNSATGAHGPGGTIEFNSQYEVVLPGVNQVAKVTGSSFVGWKIQGVEIDDITFINNNTQAIYGTLTFSVGVTFDGETVIDYYITKIVKDSYGNITLDAVWSEHGYIIQILDGDDGETIANISVSFSGIYELLINTISTSTKDKQFIGWVFEVDYNEVKDGLDRGYLYLYGKVNDVVEISNTDGNQNQPIFKDGLQVSKLTSDQGGVVKIYAIWQPKYTVTINVSEMTDEGEGVYVNGALSANNVFSNTFYNEFVLPSREESEALFAKPTGNGIQLYNKGHYIEGWNITVGATTYIVKDSAVDSVNPTPDEWIEYISGDYTVASGVNLQYLQGNIIATPIWQAMSFIVKVQPTAIATIEGVENPDITTVSGYDDWENIEAEMHYGKNYLIFNGSVAGYTTITHASLLGYTLTSVVSETGNNSIDLSGVWNYENVYSVEGGDNVVTLKATYTPNLYRMGFEFSNGLPTNPDISVLDNGDFEFKESAIAPYIMYRPVSLDEINKQVVTNPNWDEYQSKLINVNSEYYIYLLNGQLIKSYNDGASNGVELPTFAVNCYQLQYYSIGSEGCGYRSYLMTDNLKIDNVSNTLAGTSDINISPSDWRNGYCANSEPTNSNGEEVEFVFKTHWYREQVTITGINQLSEEGDTTYGAVIIAETECLTETATTPFKYHLIIRRNITGYGNVYRTYTAENYDDLLEVIKHLASGSSTTITASDSNEIKAYLGNKITFTAVDQRIFNDSRFNEGKDYISDFIGVRFSEFSIRSQDKEIIFTPNDNQAEITLTTLNCDGEPITLQDNDEIQIVTMFNYIKYTGTFIVCDDSTSTYNDKYGAIALRKGSTPFKVTTSEEYKIEEFTIKDVNNFELRLSTGSELVEWRYGTSPIYVDGSEKYTGLSIDFNADFLVKYLYNTAYSIDESQLLSNIEAICTFTELNMHIIIETQIDGNINRLDEYILTDNDKLKDSTDANGIKYVLISSDTIFNMLNNETEVDKVTIGEFNIRLLEGSTNNICNVGEITYFLNRIYLAHNSMTAINPFEKTFEHNQEIGDITFEINSRLLENAVNYTQYQPLQENNRTLNFHLVVAPQVEVTFNNNATNDIELGAGDIKINGFARFTYNYESNPAISVNKYLAYQGQQLLIEFTPSTTYYYSAVKLTINYGEDGLSETSLTIQANTGAIFDINTDSNYEITVEFVGIYYNFSAKVVHDGVEKPINEDIKTASGDLIFGNVEFVPADTETLFYGSQIKFSYSSTVTSGYTIRPTVSSGNANKQEDGSYLITFGSSDIELVVNITSSEGNVEIVPNIIGALEVAEIIGVVNGDIDNAQQILSRDNEYNPEINLNSGDNLDIYVKNYAGYKFEHKYRDANYASNQKEYYFTNDRDETITDANVEIIDTGVYAGYAKYTIISNYEIKDANDDGEPDSQKYTLQFAEVDVRVALKYYSGYYDDETFTDASEISGVNWTTITSSDFKEDPYVQLRKDIEPENYRFEAYTYKANLGSSDAIELTADEDNKIVIDSDIIAYISGQEIQGSSGNYYVTFTIYANYIRQYKYNVSVVNGDKVAIDNIIDKVTYTMVDASDNVLEQDVYYDANTTTLKLSATVSDTEHYKLTLKVNNEPVSVTSQSTTNNGNCSGFTWNEVLNNEDKIIQIVIQSETYDPTINVMYSTNGIDFAGQGNSSLLNIKSYTHNIGYRITVNNTQSYTQEDLTYNNSVRLTIIVKKPTDIAEDCYGLSKVEIDGVEAELLNINTVTIDGEEYIEYTFDYTILGDDADYGIKLYYTKYYKVDAGFNLHVES